MFNLFVKFDETCFAEKDKYFKSMQTFTKLIKIEVEYQKELIKKQIFNPLQILQVQHATLSNLVQMAKKYLFSKSKTAEEV